MQMYVYTFSLFLSLSTDGSENHLALNQSESMGTLLELQSENNVIILAPNDQEDAQKNMQQCDDNQNNVNNRMLVMQNFNINAAGERIIVNLKQLLVLHAKLKRQLVEFTKVKTTEHGSYKAKCEKMSSQVSFFGNVINNFILLFNAFN